MDLRQLKVFVAVARQGNFTRAAEQLRIAQPAVSISVRKLEEALDLTLFNRQDKVVTLTAEGEALLAHATRILDGCAAAEAEMAELKGLERGEVRIGITPMMSAYFFPRIIMEFRDRYPKLKLSVNGEGAASIQQLISRGEIDMGVIAGHRVGEGLDSRHFLREEVVGCVPKGHPLAGRGPLPFAEFLREPQIAFKQGYYMRGLLDEQIKQNGIEPDIVFETNLYSLVRSLIKEHLGVSTFLRMVVSGDDELEAVPFDPPIYLDLVIAWKANRYLSQANRAFIDFLVESTTPGQAIGQSVS